MKRRELFQLALAVPAILLNKSATAAIALPAVLAYRDPGCGCCEKWTEHMRSAGFDVSMQDDSDLAARKVKLGVPNQLSRCHTALIGPYVIEGHVPPGDIMRLLAEEPEALGLAVPGMPVGSPGMEMGDNKEPYKVVMFKADRTWTVYAKHN
jgi:hypothetical protein